MNYGRILLLKCCATEKGEAHASLGYLSSFSPAHMSEGGGWKGVSWRVVCAKQVHPPPPYTYAINIGIIYTHTHTRTGARAWVIHYGLEDHGLDS